MGSLELLGGIYRFIGISIILIPVTIIQLMVVHLLQRKYTILKQSPIRTISYADAKEIVLTTILMEIVIATIITIAYPIAIIVTGAFAFIPIPFIIMILGFNFGPAFCLASIYLFIAYFSRLTIKEAANENNKTS